MTTSSTIQESQVSGAIYTVEEAAALLKINKVTMYRYIREGKMPARRVGERGYRITDRDIEDYLSDRTTDTERESE